MSGSDFSQRTTPLYTADEISAMFVDFYEFLTTLHYDPAHLQIPPLEGWPTLTAEFCAPLASGYALEVMRRLPYFDEETRADIHYKSRLINYASYDRENFQGYDRRVGLEFYSARGEEVDPRYIICIAAGRESSGRDLFLNVMDGKITEDMIRMQQLDAVDIKPFLDSLREAYQTLKLIPCPGRVIIEAWDVEVGADEITKEQVISQEQEWGTELDVQYVRQVYRRHGWPWAFCRDEGMKSIDELMGLIVEQRGDWERYTMELCPRW